MNKIKNIIFDFGGVLLNLDVPACVAAFKALGFENVDQMIGTAHQKGVFHDFEKGLITPAAFCAALRDCIREFHPEADPSDDEILTAWQAIAVDVPAYKLAFIAQLTRHGYHVSALSNTNEVHWDFCRPMFVAAGFLPEQLFEYVWLSNELHLVKPDGAIYDRVLADSGYVPTETLFLDDSPTNCRAAEEKAIATFTPQVRSDWRRSLLDLLHEDPALFDL